METILLYQETDSWVVCEKPAGVLPEKGGLPDLLCAQLGLREVFPVHRLDRPVSGGILFAKTRQAAASLSAQAVDGRMCKEYLALVEGDPGTEGTWTDLLFHDRNRNKTYVVDRKRAGVREAKLSFVKEAEAEADGIRFSLMRIRLETGRTHQIRAQFASRGFPVAGDRRYGSKYRGTGLYLRTGRLVFTDPDTGEERDLCFPLSDEGLWKILK